MNQFTEFLNTFHTFEWRDAIDILLMAYLIYQAIKLVRETRAAQLVKGIAVLLVFYAVAQAVPLRTMRFLTENVLSIGFIAMVVVFQPELRRALEQVGRSRIGKFQVFTSGLAEQDSQGKWEKLVHDLVEEAGVLSQEKIGALMVIERDTKLGEIIKTGTVIDSAPSPELIGNIFFPNSPLHDGAMIIRDGRLHAAGCFLPLSDNREISRELGTRHRAALGMSETSDAIVVVVSEETGLITLCRNGKLTRGVSLSRLREYLNAELAPSPESETSGRFFERRKGKNA